MANKRQRQRPGFDRRQLMQRIATSAPPASTVDGQLRRFKDAKAIEEGLDPADELDDPAEVAWRDTADDMDADANIAAETALDDVDVPPPPRKPVRTFNQFKPGTRQPAPATAKVTGELPWWAKAKQGEMTKAAEHERERMQGSKEAKKVDGGKISD